MKLKKKTKKRLKFALMIFLCLMMVLPIVGQYFTNINQSSTQMSPELYKAYLESQIETKELQEKGYYQVQSVVNGNTMDVMIDDNLEKVKLIGLELPDETSEVEEQTAGEINRSILADYAEGTFVKLEYDKKKTDSDGNILAYAFMENGLFLNEEIIKTGYAKSADENENIKYADLFQEAEAFAAKEATGFWENIWKK